MIKRQKALVQFALKYKDKWHSYAKDFDTVNLICACVNLGILKTNEHGQFMLKSETHAKQYLNR